jgi:hypothetical protein
MKWKTIDGREMELAEMETSHLRNSIARIRRSIRFSGTDKVIGWRVSFLKPMVEELERRGSKDNPSLNPARITNRFRNLDLD